MIDAIKSVLSNPQSPLTDVLRAVGQIKECERFERTVRIGISGNITCDSLGTSLKRHAFLNNRNIDVFQGNYDSHLENMSTFLKERVEHVVLFHFFDAIVPHLHSRVGGLSSEFKDEIRTNLMSQFELILSRAASFQTIFIPTFHPFLRTSSLHQRDSALQCVEELNSSLALLAMKFRNVKLFHSESWLKELGRDAALDDRYYYKFKAPYKAAFMDRVARDLFLHLRGSQSYFYKALVLDCDNTLWGGVIGEDHLNGIKLDAHEYPGNIFWMIQNQILELQSKGILLVLCSKNNGADVDQVLEKHPNVVLRDRHIVLKKVNWADKAQNIKEIAAELDLGLESLIFLDDSDFEVNAVRGQLPMVRTIQVPKNLFEYPAVLHQIRELFLPWEQTEESAGKTEQYRLRAQAKNEQAAFGNQEDYLKSLNLKVLLKRNDEKSIPRISELTQKSNQFNVNTRRYSTKEIGACMSSSTSAVYSLNVSDKFGDSGLTGVAIVSFDAKVLRIDAFLMSCRVIGRGVEFAFWKKVFDDARARGCLVVQANYVKSAKNGLVFEYFEQLGLSVHETLHEGKSYSGDLNTILLPATPHIEVHYEN